MNLLVRRGVVQARANWSRWIGDCPAPLCLSAMQLTRWQPWFTCGECGETAEVEWPGFLEDIERLLVMRPDPFTRNWQPGETLLDLWRENTDHGVTPWNQLRPGLMLAVEENRIVTDTALLANRTRQLTQGG